MFPHLLLLPVWLYSFAQEHYPQRCLLPCPTYIKPIPLPTTFPTTNATTSFIRPPHATISPIPSPCSAETASPLLTKVPSPAAKTSLSPQDPHPPSPTPFPVLQQRCGTSPCSYGESETTLEASTVTDTIVYTTSVPCYVTTYVSLSITTTSTVYTPSVITSYSTYVSTFTRTITNTQTTTTTAVQISTETNQETQTQFQTQTEIDTQTQTQENTLTDTATQTQVDVNTITVSQAAPSVVIQSSVYTSTTCLTEVYTSFWTSVEGIASAVTESGPTSTILGGPSVELSIGADWTQIGASSNGWSVTVNPTATLAGDGGGFTFSASLKEIELNLDYWICAFFSVAMGVLVLWYW